MVIALLTKFCYHVEMEFLTCMCNVRDFKVTNMERDMHCVTEESQVGNTDEINRVVSQVRELTNSGVGIEMQIPNHLSQNLAKTQRNALILLCYIVHALHKLKMLSTSTRSSIRMLNCEIDRRRSQLMR